MSLVSTIRKTTILSLSVLSLFSVNAFSAECTNLYDVFNSPANKLTLNGIVISGTREGRGDGAHDTTSGDEGTSDIYTSLYNDDEVGDNKNELENYIYHRITFSQAIEIGAAFTLSDIDGKKGLKELGTLIGANNGSYVEPSFTQVGSTLTQKDYDINDLPTGISGGSLSNIPVYEGDDADQEPGDADGAVTPDFGSQLVTDLYFILAIKEKKTDDRNYSIDGCLESVPGIVNNVVPSSDYGDADASYGEAEHKIVSSPTTYLGSVSPDADPATQNDASGSSNGIGDDSDGNDDEDAHNVLPILYTTDATYEIITPCTGGSTVAGWFDIDHSGVFDANERVEGVCSGSNVTLSWQGLASISPGITSLRLRTASDSTEIANPTGVALDGEVEDYRVQIRQPNNMCANPVSFTWNGAPNNAGTQTHWTNLANDLTVNMVSAASGISYNMIASLSDPDNSLDMGLTKTDGVYGTGYLTMFKSDSRGAQNDRGDGGAFTFSFDKPVYLSAWRVDDIDEFGNFHDVVEMTALDANNNDVPLTMISVGSGISQTGLTGQTATAIVGAGNSSPNDAKAQSSWTSNFAINTLKLDYISGPNIANPSTQAIRVPGFSYCEVEFDFGDAPAAYPEASHVYTDLPVVWLGAVAPDKENSLLAGDGALGDDQDLSDDEDGVSAFAELKDSESTYSVDVVVNNVSGSMAYLVGWIDFDGNMQFDPDEAVSALVANGASGQSVTLNWADVPSDIKAGTTYARFRLTTDAAIASGLAATSIASGAAIDGEVEDYPLIIKVGGFPISGRVYEDADVDGVNDTVEAGIGGVTVVLMKVESDLTNNSCVSTKTNADGSYSFPLALPGDYQLYEASGETVPEPQNCAISNAADLASYRSTTTNTLTTFTVLDAAVTGKDFGDVRLPVFEPDNTGQILPGSVVFYTHIFTSTAIGDLTFSNVVSQQVTSGWANLLYQDLNCNGVLDGSEGASPMMVSGTKTVIATTANTRVCVINKVFAPANVVNNERQLQTITASFDYNNVIAGTVDLSVTDLSTASQPQSAATASRLELTKTVQNLTQGTAATATLNQASPDDQLKYIIYYRNTGSGPINDLVVNDSMPSYTTFQASSATCVSTPSSMTCSANVTGEALLWSFTGTLAGGGTGHVSYTVAVDQ